MIDANRGISEEVLRGLKEASYERFSIELIKSIEMLLDNFEMTWDDLAKADGWSDGDFLKQFIGEYSLTMMQINSIAHVFSMEPYILFRPRFPYTQS